MGVLVGRVFGYTGRDDGERVDEGNWPGYRVYQAEINEKAKTLKLWVRLRAEVQRRLQRQCGLHNTVGGARDESHFTML